MSGRDIAEILHWEKSAGQPSGQLSTEALPQIPSPEKTTAPWPQALLDHLASQTLTREALLDAFPDVTVTDLNTTLTMLELHGEVRLLAGGLVCRL